MLLALKVLAHRVGEDEADVRLFATELGSTVPIRCSRLPSEPMATDSILPLASSSNRSLTPGSAGPVLSLVVRLDPDV